VPVPSILWAHKALRGTESWTPLCLPRFNANGYLYSYVGYLDESADLCLLLLSASQAPETFMKFQQCAQAARTSLEKEGALQAIRRAHDLDAAPAAPSHPATEVTFPGPGPAAATGAATGGSESPSPAAGDGRLMYPTPPPKLQPNTPPSPGGSLWSSATQLKPLHFLYVHRSSPKNRAVPEPTLPQYLCPPAFPFPLNASARAVAYAWADYQRSVLRSEKRRTIARLERERKDGASEEATFVGVGKEVICLYTVLKYQKKTF